MTIKCLHGYFIIREENAGELSQFINMTGISLVPVDDYYTFEKLGDAKDYSIEGADYLGAVATKTFAGKPWEVMRENGIVYDFSDKKMKKITTITNTVDLQEGDDCFVGGALVLAGAIKDNGKRVTEYSASFGFFESFNVEYSEVIYE